MQVNISGHHIEVTPALRNYVTEKLDKLEKRFKNITNVQVTLNLEKKFQHFAKAELHLAGGKAGKLFASSEEKNMYAAIDTLTDKLSHLITKHKEKLQDHHEGEPFE